MKQKALKFSHGGLCVSNTIFCSPIMNNIFQKTIMKRYELFYHTWLYGCLNICWRRLVSSLKNQHERIRGRKTQAYNLVHISRSRVPLQVICSTQYIYVITLIRHESIILEHSSTCIFGFRIGQNLTINLRVQKLFQAHFC